jgi:preprotein translocase subunit SecG
MGGLTGQDAGGVFSQRRGIEKTLFWITIILAIVFVILVMATIAIG